MLEAIANRRFASKSDLEPRNRPIPPGDQGAAPELDASDLTVGDPASLYSPAPVARHTWEASDSLTISADRRTLTINSIRVGDTQPFADQIRVILAPEPSPAVLLLMGFVGLSLRQRIRSR
jgi:hypothetical protein